MIYLALFFTLAFCKRFLASNEYLSSVPQCYGAIFDAGSSGTRVYIYEWECREQWVLPMVNVTESKNNKKITPGLASFANNLTGIQPYLQPLLDFIYTIVPTDLQQYTPVMLGATAGMRVLPISNQTAIINTVQGIFKSSKLLYDPEWVRVITGQEEVFCYTIQGMYMWMSVYYLLNQTKLSLLTIDLGGASTQNAFSYNGTSQDFVQISVNIPPNITNHSLYSVSYLGYGNDMARNAILAMSMEEGSYTIATPCYFEGYQAEWDANKTYQILGKGSLTNCTALIKKYLNTTDSSSINGSYEPPVTDQTVYATNGVQTIASFLNLPSFTLPSYYNNMYNFTSLTWDQAKQLYPQDNYLSTNYFLSIYAYELMKDGYNIPVTSTIQAPAEIDGVSPSWTLAACAYQLAQISCNSDSPVCQYGQSSILTILQILIFIIIY